MTLCIYCKAEDDDYHDGIPLCVTCVGRFTEVSQKYPSVWPKGHGDDDIWPNTPEALDRTIAARRIA